MCLQLQVRMQLQSFRLGHQELHQHMTQVHCMMVQLLARYLTAVGLRRVRSWRRMLTEHCMLVQKLVMVMVETSCNLV